MGVFDGMDGIFLGAFGEDAKATWTAAASGVVTLIPIIWDPEHTDWAVADGATIETTAIAAHASLADVPGIAVGDRLGWQGVTYRITTTRADAHCGMMVLLLQRMGRPA